MSKKIFDESGDDVAAELADDIIGGEVLQSEDGNFYEITKIEDETITVKLVEVEEDWGQ